MKNTIGTGDTEIDKEGAMSLRVDVIALRDEALKQAEVSMAVILSHTIAFMANAIDEIWPGDLRVPTAPEQHPPLVRMAVEKIAKDLDWKGPTGKTMAMTVLPRDLAEALLTYIKGGK